jgi:uroporphyrin-III C-methyltransferase/precorrin-2 dehydrogenase/sirohydrochlorin ferrochelatase
VADVPPKGRAREPRRSRPPEAYLAGLLLAGRRVVVVGGGAVAARRIHRLLAAGADVVVISPKVTVLVRELVDTGRLTWVARRYRRGDLDGAWYAVAATDDPEVNAAVAAEAEAGRVFCVRVDRSREGSALTPATGAALGLRVGVVSDGDADPHRAAAARDALLALLESGRAPIPPPAHRPYGP